MSRQILSLTFRGLSPLLMHAGRLSDPLDPIAHNLKLYHEKPRLSADDHMAIATLEFIGGMWVDGDQPCVPARTLEAVLREAVKRQGADPRVARAVSVDRDAVLRHPGPLSIDELAKDPTYRHRAAVTVDGMRRMRTRPRFETWSIDVEIAYDLSIAPRDFVIDCAIHAGDAIGIGAGRPRHGRFAVTPTT